MKTPPYALFLGAPLLPLALVVCGYALGSNIGHTELLVAAGMTVVGWGGAAFLWFSDRKVKAHRLFIDIKPSMIETMDGAVVHQPFSSSTHFLSDPDALEVAISEVCRRPQYVKGRFMFPTEAVHARLWPGELGVSRVEAERILETLSVHFIDPVLEVVERTEAASSALRA